MNYDSFSVHDLVCEALALQERAQLMGDREPFTDAMLAEIESVLRRAVIREASVKEVSVEIGDHKELVLVSLNYIPQGTYYLVKKETP